MEEYNLKFSTASIVEINPSYIGVLMDGNVHYNIGITNMDTEIIIKKAILTHACDVTGSNIAPFNKISEIPQKIRDSLNYTIDLSELKKEVLEQEEEKNKLKHINCNNAREEILPNHIELIEALYEKDVKNDPDKYDKLLERIKLAYELFPLELGEIIPVKKYEEILNGL